MFGCLIDQREGERKKVRTNFLKLREKDVEFVDDGDGICVIRSTVELESAIVRSEDVTEKAKEGRGVSPRIEFGRRLLKGELSIRSQHADKEDDRRLLDHPHRRPQASGFDESTTSEYHPTDERNLKDHDRAFRSTERM